MMLFILCLLVFVGLIILSYAVPDPLGERVSPVDAIRDKAAREMLVHRHTWRIIKEHAKTVPPLVVLDLVLWIVGGALSLILSATCGVLVLYHALGPYLRRVLLCFGF